MTYLRFAVRPRGGQRQRRGGASWETVTNRQQVALTRVFDEWAAPVKRRLVRARERGDSVNQRLALLDAALPALEEAMVAQLQDGLLTAIIASAGPRAGFPNVLDILELKTEEAVLLMRDNYIPHVREGLGANIEAGRI